MLKNVEQTNKDRTKHREDTTGQLKTSTKKVEGKLKLALFVKNVCG